MEKRRMLTIGEQTGIKELDDVRQCGFYMYNLNDVVKVLGIERCELKRIISKYELDKCEDGCWYVNINILKMILVEYQDSITQQYTWHVVCNDTRLQEHGIVVDDRFMEDNQESIIMKEYNKITHKEVDYDSCKGNNYICPLDNIGIESKILSDDDFDLIYKIIDEN